MGTRATSRRWIIPLAAGTAFLFLRLFSAGFLSWDDVRNVTANPYYTHLGWWHLWASPYFGMYVPVTSTAWAALFNLANGAAWPFRVFNALLHTANTVLAWQLCRTFLERHAGAAHDTPGVGAAALVGAALFAFHPLQVGAVAWISGGRDLLAVTLGLSSVLVYFRRSGRSYAIATLLFTAALLSKPSVAALPVAVAAYVALFERDQLADTLRAMAVWTLLVAADAAATSHMQSEMARVTVRLGLRPLVALDALGFYLTKTIWPARLSVDYGRTPAWVVSNSGAVLRSIAALTVGASVAAWSARRTPMLRVALLWVIVFLPVLGFATFAFQRISTVADHYAYPAMVVSALVASVGAYEAGRRHRARMLVAASMIIAASAAASWSRLAVWRSDDALFSDALAENPASAVALINVGRIACERRDFVHGLDYLGRALAQQPAEASAIADKAYCLYNAGAFDEVVEMRGVLRDGDTRFSFDHNADAASAFANVMAGALFELRAPMSGWAFLCQAIALNPFDAALRQNADDVASSLVSPGAAAPACPPRRAWEDLAAAGP